MVTITTIREHAGEGVARAVSFTQSRPSLLGRLISYVFLAAVGLLALAILIPVVIFVLAAGFVVFLYIRIKVWLATARQPNGPLDGRKNVRVREPGSDG